jgi:hypothetical protein
MRIPVYRIRGRLGDYAIGALSGLAAAAFYIGTVPALIAAAVLILAALAVFAIQAVWAVQINRIFREEVDEHRERDEFAMERRVEYRTPPTNTGETQ